ncbi:MAG: hypothetical protein GXY47_11460 [Acidobacteria bacterium]|nr:hypothetical protein [Acidobacteriota bacterium]
MEKLLGLFAMTFLLGASARGEEVTFSFRGTVHEMDGEFLYLSGHPFELTFTFERTTDDGRPGDPESGSYVGALRSGALVVYNGQEYYRWEIGPGGQDNFIEVRNLPGADSFVASAALSGSIYENEIPAHFYVEWIDRDGVEFDGDGLPATLEAASFEQRHVHLTFIGIRKHVYSTLGVVTSSSTP